jgi:hypothetical protein
MIMVAPELRVADEANREIADARKRDIADTSKSNSDAAKAYIDRKKRDYFRQIEEIARKRLELNELEKPYTTPRLDARLIGSREASTITRCPME